MRILQITRDFPPAASGIGDYADRVSSELVAHGDEVVVLCSGPASQRADFQVRAAVKRWNGRSVREIARAAAAEKPDAIIWHYNPFQVGAHGLAPLTAPRLARALSKIAPLTIVFHELWYPWGRSGARGFVWGVAQRAQAGDVLRSARKAIVTTEARRSKLSRRFPRRAEDISFIPVGPTVLPTAEPNGFRAALGIPESAFVLAHLGAIGEGRDLAPAIDALEHARANGRDVRLLLVGRTGVTPPRNSSVVATGPLHGEDLSQALASADAYLFAEPTGPTSRKTSLISALAHGLPVIAYRGPDGEPQFRDGENVLLVQPDAGAVAEAIKGLGSQAVAAKLGWGAKRLAEDLYSWRAIGEATRRVVKESL